MVGYKTAAGSSIIQVNKDQECHIEREHEEEKVDGPRYANDGSSFTSC